MEGDKKISKNEAKSFTINPFKADVFSIGVCLLEIMGIDNLRKIISVNPKKVKPEHFKDL